MTPIDQMCVYHGASNAKVSQNQTNENKILPTRMGLTKEQERTHTHTRTQTYAEM